LFGYKLYKDRMLSFPKDCHSFSLPLLFSCVQWH